jgi:hypothetical protein
MVDRILFELKQASLLTKQNLRLCGQKLILSTPKNYDKKSFLSNFDNKAQCYKTFHIHIYKFL